jgi:hypothetical protein
LLPNNNHIHQQKPSSSSLGSHDNSLANSLESGGQQLRLEKGFGAIFNNLQQHLNTNNHSNNKNNMNNNNTNYANNNVAPAGGLIVAKIPTE